MYHKVLMDSRAQLVTQKLEEQVLNYNQLVAQLQVEQKQVKALTVENEQVRAHLKLSIEETNKMKEINKELLDLLRFHQIPNL